MLKIIFVLIQTGSVGPESLPVYMRIVTRGAVADIRSDISSLELFAVSTINSLPSGLFCSLLLSSFDFFQNQFFEKFFQEYHQSVSSS